jgi:hypothetical protein
LKLISLIVEQHINITTPQVYNSIIKLTKLLNQIPVHPASVEDVCAILIYVTGRESDLKFHQISADYIARCLAEYLEHDKFAALEELSRKLEEPFKLNCSQSIKSEVEELWEHEIDEMISCDGALEGFLDIAEEYEARKKIEEYLYEKLSYFDFAEEEITSLAERADIEGQIEANQEAEMRDREDFEAYRDSRGTSPQDENFQINDLFERS